MNMDMATKKKAPVDIAKAKAALARAITLHKKHMNGTAPTTPASQEAMMKMMLEAWTALGN